MKEFLYCLIACRPGYVTRNGYNCPTEFIYHRGILHQELIKYLANIVKTNNNLESDEEGYQDIIIMRSDTLVEYLGGNVFYGFIDKGNPDYQAIMKNAEFLYQRQVEEEKEKAKEEEICKFEEKEKAEYAEYQRLKKKFRDKEIKLKCDVFLF